VRRTRAVAAPIAIGLLIVSLARAAAGPAGLSPVNVSGVQTLAFNTSTTTAQGREQAQLNVLVRNDATSGGTLQVRFFAERREIVASVKAAQPAKKEPLTVTIAAPKALDVGAHDVFLLSVVFNRPTKPKPSPLAGNLVIRLAGRKPVGPLLIPVATKAGKEAGAAQPLKFAQKKATISLVRIFGPLTALARWTPKVHCDQGCLIGEGVTIATHGTKPKSASTLLSADSGGSTKIKLSVSDGSTSHLSASNVRRPGKYEGDLVIEPAAKTPISLAVTVHARDLILWPLLVFLLGVAVAWFGLHRWEEYRSRLLAERELKRAIDPYLEARTKDRKLPKAKQRPQRFYLDRYLPDDSSSPYLKGKSCDNLDDISDVSRLYCRASQIDSEDALTELLPDLTEMTARFDRWAQLDRARQQLRRDVQDPPKMEKMRKDAEQLMARTERDPDDDKQATEYLGLLNHEEAIGAVYRLAREAFDSKPDGWPSNHKKLDPDLDLKKLNPAATRDGANMDRVHTALLLTLDRLQQQDETLRPADDHPQHAEVMTAFAERFAWTEAFSRLPTPTRHVLSAVRDRPPPVIDTRSPAAIYAHVRRVDWAVFAVSAVLTGLGYLAVKYGADYGSVADYLTAFAAGAVGPTLVNWALLPYSRPSKPQPPAPPATTTTTTPPAAPPATATDGASTVQAAQP
jgi:hypothetical protein